MNNQYYNTTKKHKHGPYDSYIVLNQHLTETIPTAQLTPTALKLLFLALGRMNDTGHAQFGRSELRRTLGVTRMTIYRTKIALHKHGYLTEPTGGESCVWISAQLAFRQSAGSKCNTHKI